MTYKGWYAIKHNQPTKVFVIFHILYVVYLSISVMSQWGIILAVVMKQ